MLLGGASSWLAAALAAALALSCRREPGERAATPEPEPTTVQQDERPATEHPAPEPSRRATRQRRAAAGARTIRRVEGRLEHRSREQVVIRAAGEERVTLRIAEGTAITLDGAPVGVDALREGSEVRAAYEVGRAGRATAVSLDGRSSGPGEDRPPGQTSPNSGERGSPGGG